MSARPASAGLRQLAHPDRIEAAQWRRLRDGSDPLSRERLFETHMPFARQVAHREFARRIPTAAERGDFEQWAFEALLQSIERYDPVHGVGFRGFAKPRILGNIANHLPRMSESGDEYGFRLRTRRDRMRSLRADGDDGADALDALARLAVGLATGLILDAASEAALEPLADPAPSAYDTVAWNELTALVVRQIDDLPEREATVLRQHYLNGVRFAHIAELLGLSRGRVSQLHGAGIDRIRRRLGPLARE